MLLLSSVAAAVAGMLYAGRLQSGRFQFGEGDELSVIAAAVLGGTSLFGGAGTVIGSIMGALMIGLINNGLVLMGLEFSQQLIARGAIIILAVAHQPDPRAPLGFALRPEYAMAGGRWVRAHKAIAGARTSPRHLNIRHQDAALGN